jgi:hypothetical protein
MMVMVMIYYARGAKPMLCMISEAYRLDDVPIDLG